MNVLYEDNHLLVVEKPYGVPSQADSSGDDDMLSLCKAYIKKKYGKPGEVYLGLVHRLDRPARGVMVFARTSKAAARLSAQIRSGAFEKTYLAVLTAAPKETKGALWHHLVKDEAARIARVADENIPGAKKAGLEYEVLQTKDGLCFVSIRLLSGRYHQIRAQFSHIGCSVYGDMKYGPRDIKAELALFASRVCLDHPTKGDRMCFSLTPRHFPFDLFDK
ncbi:MAG: RNA pseudouridine synthase [Eubacteriales bacterium]|nr:RNA pseudouridine synthase [Eubacteriales bacterium]